MSIGEQLAELEVKANMLKVLSCITSSLLEDESYTKKAAANDLLKFLDSEMQELPCISKFIDEL